MKKIKFLITLFPTLLFLAGCMYPHKEMAQQIPNENQIADVQAAVTQYWEDHDGLLPIKNSESDTDIYIKYTVDFKQLVPHYLPQAPPNSFEKGGVFQYVIIDPETNPTVKIFDLRIAETIRNINIKLSTRKYPPYLEMVGDNMFSLDYKKLGYDEEPKVLSPFSNEMLPIVITGDGTLIVDYRIDLYQALQKNENITFEPGEDIRSILTDESDFVPAYSKPYTIDESGEIVLMNNGL